MNLFIFLLLALGVSFLCSFMEAILLSTPVTFINMKVAEEKKAAFKFKEYKENINKPLSAILAINTIANTVGATGVGAIVASKWGNNYLALASALLTLTILLLAEILPKTLGTRYWRKFALSAVPVFKGMIIIAYPLVYLSAFIAKMFKKDNELTISREEVSAMVNIAAEEGEFEIGENKIIQNIMKLESVKVDDVMTPQIVVSIAPEEMSVADFYKNKDFLHYARIPVYADQNEDHITGYVLRQTVLENMANDNFNAKLSDIRRSIVVAEEGQSITTLWETLLKEKEHIALIVDQYGTFSGIVTLEDIIESILGLEIVDETDNIVDMQQYARTKWKERREKYRHIISEKETE